MALGSAPELSLMRLGIINAYAIAGDIRHDLELLADQVNPPNVRPPGWKGSVPVIRCDRSVQTLIFVLERTASYKLNVDPLSA
jgi:hypothetical protein